MSPAVYPGAVFEQANPALGFSPIRYEVIERAPRHGWWTCKSRVGERPIPERALLNPRVYRQVA